MDQRFMPLTDAAHALKLPYHRALRLVLIGDLEGRRADNGRWEIQTASVKRIARERQRGGIETAALR